MTGGLLLDVRYVLRVLAASPVFTSVAVLSLAIGIGANTMLFSVARFAILDPLPVDRPEQLRVVQWGGPAALEVSQYNSGGSTNPATGRAIRTNYNHLAARALEGAHPAGVDLFAFNFISQVTVGVENGPAVAAGGLMASGRYFPVLRPPMAMGRGLTPDDDSVGAPNAAVISHAFWRRAFAGNPRVVGTVVPINGTPFTIVGVTGPGFRGLSSGTRFAPLTDVTIPISKQPVVWTPEGGSFLDADSRLWLRMMARVPPGSDDHTVSQALVVALRGAFASAPFLTPEALAGVDVTLTPGIRGLDSLGSNAGGPLRILSAVVAIVLLIACVNLAGLSLARGASRRRELAVRRALGASRGRLVRHLLIESSIVAMAGGLVGGVLAMWLRPVAASMVAAGFGAPSVELPIDWRTLALTASVSSLAGLLFGLVPAIALTKPESTMHLRQRALGGTTPKLTVGRVLLALQIAISLPLIVGSTLLVRTVVNLTRVDLGFNPEGLVTFQLDPNQGRPGGAASAPGVAPLVEDVDLFARRVLEGIEGLPGVASATLLENALVSGWVSNNNVTIDGQRKSIHMNGVGPRYFETMQIPLEGGRAPTLDDTRHTPRVAVVNQTAALRLFGTPSPIGRRFTMGRNEIEVVGVAADTKYSGLRAEVVPTMFDPFLQRAAAGLMNVVVRVKGPSASLEADLRRAVAAANPNVPITGMRTQLEQVGLSMGRERLLARLMSVFGGFSLVLACIGLYGATAYSVARRTNEIGVRMALGARRTQVVWLILRQVLTLAIAGLAVGIPAALAAGPLVGSLLFGLGPRDAGVIVFASALMLGVALAAGFVPARRAARIEVLTALRQE